MLDRFPRGLEPKLEKAQQEIEIHAEESQQSDEIAQLAEGIGQFIKRVLTYYEDVDEESIRVEVTSHGEGNGLLEITLPESCDIIDNLVAESASPFVGSDYFSLSSEGSANEQAFPWEKSGTKYTFKYGY